MTNEKRAAMAKAHHDLHGLNCAQSVVSAFSDILPLAENQLTAVASGMGTGFRYGGICGTVSGAAIVLGLLYPQIAGDATSKTRIDVLVREFERRFLAQFPSLECRELKIIPDASASAEMQEAAVKECCGRLIVASVLILCEYLEELKQE